MIIVDTNILSTFARVNKLSLLFELFKHDEIAISPNVLQEINDTKARNFSYAEKLINLINENKIKVISLKQEEELLAYNLPTNFGSGEKDSIAVAKKRNCLFLTNERKLINYCQREEIDCLWLDKLLRVLWRDNILTKEQVRELIDEIEEKDSLIITSKDEILAD